MIAMVMVMALFGAEIVHLVDAATLRAALDGTVLADGEPDDGVRVDGTARAA